MLRQRQLRLSITACLFLIVAPVAASQGQRTIQAGLGVTLGEPLAVERLGAELFALPGVDHVRQDQTQYAPGLHAPWRILRDPAVPRQLRGHPARAFVMLDTARRPMHVVLWVDTACGEIFTWLHNTLARKYGLGGDARRPADAPYAHALRIVAKQRQIDARCGDDFVLEYRDTLMLEQWTAQVDDRQRALHRAQNAVDKRQLVLEQRRAIRFADSFTLGNPYRLDGGFGVEFGNPFAPNSKHDFPSDVPFIVGLPNLPPEFADGEIQLILSPDKHPIAIRGTFAVTATGLTFEKVAGALKAKYGSAMKSSERHVIHKVAGNHAIVKRLPRQQVEIAFIDNGAKSEQTERLWAEESEGL